MEAMVIILELLSVIELAVVIGGIFFYFSKKKREQSENERKIETSKMVKKIMLSNQWENIDHIIEILRKDSIHIKYKLR